MACLINRDHSFIFEIAPKYCISNSFDGYESAAFNMPANLENTAVATGQEKVEKVSFHSNPKERKCQRMLKLPHNCTHLTHQQSNAQNSLSKASIVHEL